MFGPACGAAVIEQPKIRQTARQMLIKSNFYRTLVTTIKPHNNYIIKIAMKIELINR